MNHLDDDAELYALGLTDRERDADIEAHLAACDACRARVVAAEAAAASLAATLPPMPAATAPRAWWATAAVAAAFAFAASTAYEGIAAHNASAQLTRTGVALGAIASSHFGHTTMTTDDSSVVVKALYARDGAWLYIVAEHAPPGAHVTVRNGAKARDLGALDAGTPATLFVRSPGRADEVSLTAGDRLVAHGKPAYSN